MYELIFASCGLILSNLLGLNLLYTYIKNINKESGDKITSNILIFTILFYNSINWIIYSFWFNNLFLFLGSLCVPLGSFLCITTSYDILSTEKKIYFTIITIIFYILLIVYVLILKFTNINENIKDNIVNYSLGLNIIVSVMPLSSILIIIKNKSTQTLYIPFTIINAIASLLWLNYGIILNNNFLIFIFAFGLLASIVEIILYIIYNPLFSSHFNCSLPLIV
jgi:uncharacterized protein with PQ loop repeat